MIQSKFKSSQLSNSSFKEGCMNPQWRWACARREGHLTLYLARPSGNRQAHLHLLDGSFLDTKCLDRASGSQREILYTHKLICKKCLQEGGHFRTTTSLKMWQTLPKGVIFIWGAPRQCTFHLPLWGFLYQQSMFSISHEVPFLPGSHLSMCGHLLNVGGDSLRTMAKALTSSIKRGKKSFSQSDDLYISADNNPITHTSTYTLNSTLPL